MTNARLLTTLVALALSGIRNRLANRIAPLVGDTPAPADERVTLLHCRERFVMDGWEKIGTDPAVPG